MSSPLKKVILVTGANKGIGLETVRLLSEQLPASTILLGTRSIANGQAAIDKLQKSPSSSSTYSNIHPIQLDVTDAQSLSSAVAEVKRGHGHLDVLVNNGAIASVDGQGVHRGVMDVNLYGVRACIEAFLPVLAPHASLITVSSEVGAWTTHYCGPELQQQLLNPATLEWSTIDSLAQSLFSSPSQWPDSQFTFGTYGVSKALLSAYMRRVALDHPELSVAVVCPGYCATDINFHSGPRSAAQGGASVIWPITHSFESGHFYQDGKDHSWSRAPPPEQFTPKV